MIVYLFLAILIAKLIPHPPSVTPLLAFVYMVGVVQHKQSLKSYDWLLTFIVIVISSMCGDVILSCWHGYPAWGAWSWFNVLGLWACVVLGRNSHDYLCLSHWRERMAQSARRGCIEGSRRWMRGNMTHRTAMTKISAYLSFGYWGLTNLGVFLTSALYPQNIHGFIRCYIMALPFLPGLYLSTALTLILFTSLYFSGQRSTLVDSLIKNYMSLPASRFSLRQWLSASLSIESLARSGSCVGHIEIGGQAG